MLTIMAFVDGSLDAAKIRTVLDYAAALGIDEPYIQEITEAELRYLVGTGVTAAAIWRMRQVLNEAGFPKARIVASSGFGPEKCRIMAAANAPIDVIGTGSYLPELWSETYATADIIAYDGEPMVKAGREFLLRSKR